MGIYSKQVETTIAAPVTLRQQRRQEALELARILYDIYKKRRTDVKISNGQNNADEPKNN